MAFTTWLDPQLAVQQASAIRDVFSYRWKEHAPTFEANCQALEKELRELDAQFEAAFSEIKNEPLIGSHPVYQYLTQRYGLNMKSVHWEPDALPDQTMERELDDMLEAHPAKIMLWEGAPLPTIQLMVEKKGLQPRVFDPCGNRPAHGDYFTVMQENLQNLKTH
nr:zinc ABC transporter substrate-binding protein [Pontiella sulfatireligans]